MKRANSLSVSRVKYRERIIDFTEVLMYYMQSLTEISSIISSKEVDP